MKRAALLLALGLLFAGCDSYSEEQTRATAQALLQGMIAAHSQLEQLQADPASTPASAKAPQDPRRPLPPLTVTRCHHDNELMWCDIAVGQQASGTISWLDMTGGPKDIELSLSK